MENDLVLKCLKETFKCIAQSTSTCKCLPSETKIQLYSDLYTNVTSNFSHNNQNLNTTQTSINILVDEYILVSANNRILFNNKKEWNIDIHSNMN